MEDLVPIRAQISRILRSCNLEETKKILDFCNQFKQPSTKSTRGKSAATKIESEQEKKPELPITIDYLCGKWMHCVGQVAQWTFDMYFKGKRPESYEKVLATTKVCYAAMLPIRLVAVDGPNCVGSISIIKHEQAELSFTPLLTFICVPDQFKNMGIEQKLIRQSIKVLKGLGYREAFIKVQKANLLPEDMTWELIQDDQGIYKYKIPSAIATTY